MRQNDFNTADAFKYENAFYSTCKGERIGKLLAHYELYKKVTTLPGEIVECGIFKGNSFFRFSHFRGLVENVNSRKIIGFDVFGDFPKSELEDEKKYVDNFINLAGSKSIDQDSLKLILRHKNIENYELIKGDINQTVPEYCLQNPSLKIALLHIDVDLYEPTKVILEYMYNSVVRGGLIVFDDYGTFPGETRAIDEFFKNKKETIHKLSISYTPSYCIKN